MDQKLLNVGDKKLNFVLAVDPASGLPAWCTMEDEFWILMVGSSLYDWLNSHRAILLRSSLENRNAYAASLKMNDFRTAILSGEALRFRDCALALKELLEKGPKMADATYISFFSNKDNSDHYVSVMFDNDSVKIGVVMN